MIDVIKEANEADVIIQGYAIQRCHEGIRVLNLINEKSAAVFKENGILLETNMDDIEVGIARDYMISALKYMED